MNLFRLIGLLGTLSCLLVSSLRGQGAVDGGAMVVKVRGSFTTAPNVTGTLHVSQDVEDPDNPSREGIVMSVSGTGSVATPERPFTLPVGQSVRFTATASGVTNFTVTFAAPRGYHMLLDGIQRDGVYFNAPGTEFIDVMLVRSPRGYQEPTFAGSGALGDASSISVGPLKSSFAQPGLPRIEFNLGNARNGEPLPPLSLLLNDSPYWGALGCFERYLHPDADVDPMANGGFRLEAPQLAVEIDPTIPARYSATSPRNFTLRFYRPGETSNPFVVYQCTFSLVPSGIAFHYKGATLTKILDGTSYETSIMGDSAAASKWHDVNTFGTWTIRDWHRGATEQRKSVTVRSATGPTGFITYHDDVTVSDAAGAVAAKRRIEYRKTSTTFTEPGGSYSYDVWAVSKITEGYGSATVTPHQTEILLDPSNRPVGSRLASQKTAVTEYQGTGATLRPLRVHDTWLDNSPGFDAATGGITQNNNRVIEYLYTDDWNKVPVLPTSIRHKQGTNLLGESRIDYTDETTTATKQDGSVISYDIVTSTRYDFEAAGSTGGANTPRSASDGTRLMTVYKKYRGDTNNPILVNRPHSLQRPDGTKLSFVYEKGTYATSGNTFTVSASGTDLRVTVLQGVATGGTVITALASGAAPGSVAVDSIGLIAGTNPTGDFFSKSTKTVEIFSRGLMVRREVHAFTGGNATAPTFELLGWENLGYLANGEVQSRQTSNNTTYLAQWASDRSTQTITDETGLATTLNFDSADRVVATSQVAVGDQVSAQSTSITYDAENRVRTVTRGPAGATALVTQRLYDDRGILSQLIEPGGIKTKFEHLNNLRDLHITHHFETDKAAARNLTRHIDGRTQREWGAGVVEEHYTYDFDPGVSNYPRVTRRLGPDPDGTGAQLAKRPSVTVFDLLGRVVREQVDGHGSSGAAKALITMHEYYPGSGRLWRRYTVQKGTPDLPISGKFVMKYDEVGQLSAAGLDLNDSGDFQDTGVDRYQTFDSYFYRDGSNVWWRKSSASVYHTDLSASTHTTSSQSRLGTLTAGILAQSTSKDIHGNVASETVYATNTTNVKNRRVVSVDTDGTSLDRILVYGLVTMERWFDDADPSLAGTPTLSTTFYYDAQGRLTKAIDGRTGGNPSITYREGTGWPWQIRDPRGITVATHTYDAAGRLASTTSPAGAVNYTYTVRGELEDSSGTSANPTRRTYTDFGELKELKTFRSGFTGTADVTQWLYDDNTGWLNKKIDAALKETVYSYSFDNGYRDVTQRWARSPGNEPRVTQRYSLKTGDLMVTDYSGQATAQGTETTDVSYTYTRTGQVETITDAAGLRTFYYQNEQLKSEFLSDWFGKRAVTPIYQSGTSTGANSVNRRYAGYKLGVYTGSPSADLATLDQDKETAVGYSYDNFGRIGGVTVDYKAQGARSALSVPSTYRYKGGSAMWDKLTQGNYTSERVFEDNRDVILSITGAHTVGGTIASFGYQTDDAGRREWTTQVGMAFADFVETPTDATYYRYTYDGRGQLTGAQGYRGSNPSAITSPLPGRGFSYTYDDAGNRKTASVSGSTANYREGTGTGSATGANPLNQSLSRGTLPTRASGTSHRDAAISVGGTTAQRESTPGRYWDAALPSPAAGQNVSMTVSATLPGQTAQTREIQVLTRPADEVLNYDFDGNLTDDGQWTYEWDAANRLKRMTRNAIGASWGAPYRQLTFEYDYLGRRIQKTVREGSSTGPIVYNRKFIYEGWNLIAEMDVVGGAIVRSYAWGLDVASSLTATGGVGAMVLQTIHTTSSLTSYHASYDANGNVVALVNRNPGNSTDGAVAVAYEYGPFGENVRTRIDPSLSQAIKDELKTQPFRFSTKFTDVETGLIYYGLRFYDPSAGRFINRDPIGEAGGANLYGFVGNGPTNRIDVLGLADADTHPNEKPPRQDVYAGPASSRVPTIWIIAPDLTFDQGIERAKNAETERAIRGPNSEITAARDTTGIEGGVAHLRGLKDRLGEMVGGLVYIVTHVPETIEGIRNPVVKERLTPYGSDLDHLIIETKMKLRGPYGRGEIMAEIVTLRIGSALIFLKRGAQAVAGRVELIAELQRQGIKHSAADIVRIVKTGDGRLIFLEKGNSKAGLQHIIERHADDFARRGVPAAEIPDLVMKAVTAGKYVGTLSGGRPIYQVSHGGRLQTVAVDVGDNGFIVGANPATFP